jgi:hypothetical protein
MRGGGRVYEPNPGNIRKIDNPYDLDSYGFYSPWADEANYEFLKVKIKIGCYGQKLIIPTAWVIDHAGNKRIETRITLVEDSSFPYVGEKNLKKGDILILRSTPIFSKKQIENDLKKGIEYD